MNTPSANQSNRYAPPQAEVSDTIEDAEAELAGRAERFGAAVVDGIIIIVAFLPLIFTTNLGSFSEGDLVASLVTPGAIVSLIAMLVLIGVTFHLVHKNGQTIGKKIVGIKVVRADGSRATLGRIFWLRNVVNAIPGAIPFVGNVYGIVDHVFIFTGERRQCVHDKIADTIVVKA